MRKLHNIDLDFAKDIRSQRKITFKEQDSITLAISIYDDSVPVNLEGQTQRLFIKKADGTILYQTKVKDVERNTVTFDVDVQATTCPGLCYGEVEIIEPKEDGADELVTTRSFVYLVEPKVGDIQNAIASVNEAYFLKLVEDFIAQSKIDIANFKKDAAALEARVEKTNQDIDELNKKIEEKNTDLIETSNAIVNTITTTKTDALTEIDTIHTEAKNSLTNLKEEYVSTIEETKEDALSEMDEKQSEIDASVKASKEELEELMAEAIETAENGVEDVREAINELNPVIDRANTSKNELNSTISESEDSKDALEGTISTSNSTQVALEQVISIARNIISIMQDEEAEANEVADALDKLITRATELLGNLADGTSTAREEYERLNGLNVTGEKTIETLESLIQEAREIAIPALRAYIDSFSPAYDLTEVNTKLEELYRAVGLIEVDIKELEAKVYTKEETDEKLATLITETEEKIAVSASKTLASAKEYTDKKSDTFKGEVGTSVFKNKPDGFDEALKEYLASGQIHTDFPKLEGEVIGKIEGVVGYQNGTTSLKMFPGVLLYTNYNNLLSEPTTKVVFKEAKTFTQGLGGMIAYKKATSSSYSPLNSTIFPLYTALLMYDVELKTFTASKMSSSTYPNLGVDLNNLYYSDLDITNSKVDTIYVNKCENGEVEAKVTDFNDAIYDGKYKVSFGEGDEILNAPLPAIEGVLVVEVAKGYVTQEVKISDGICYTRTLIGEVWSGWTKSASGADILSFADRIGALEKLDVKSYTHTNGDGQPEVYNWTQVNGMKFMWIDVKLSESEYNSGSAGAMMKTLNFPAQAQIFSNIIMANITSFNRTGGADTLSRVVQNAEIMSNTSVRGRWRHTDNTYPRIDRFRMLVIGM